MMRLKLILSATMVAAFLTGSAAVAQDGTDVNQAIPIYFGQSIKDVIDVQLKPLQVYSITLAAGQKFTVGGASPGGNWCIGIFAPATRTIANAGGGCGGGALASDGGNSGVTINYQVSVGGKYYILIYTNRSSITYTFQVSATGTPIAVPNPQTAGCLTGSVDSITYSLQLIAAGLPDEVSIGGQRACASCTVKPPLYPEIADRLEKALRYKVNVDACYDSAGNIFQIKLRQ